MQPKFLFVPTPVYEDLRAVNYRIDDILNYDKVSKVLSTRVLRTLVCINAIGPTSVEPMEIPGLQDLPAYEKFAPLLSEALDVRKVWLENGNDIADFLPKSEHDYTPEQFMVDTLTNIKSLLAGLTVAGGCDAKYESITATNTGEYFFVLVPVSLEDNIEVSTVKKCHDAYLQFLLRKMAVFYQDKDLASLPLYSIYLKQL